MTNSQLTPGIASGRLPADAISKNFQDIEPAFDAHEAHVAADRCYFCHDAPCITACPTSIDIPLFIRQIATGTPEAAARTIWDQNILGGMCARVCPTETLCEEACVREEAEGKPVEIGRLQRYATAQGMMRPHPYSRAPSTGRRVAVVGAGPAGLACAHRLAMRGSQVTIFEKRPKAGGLNEYGIAAYKATNDFAQAEVDWLMQIGGIEIRHGEVLGETFDLDWLRQTYDAVFLGVGLGNTNRLGLSGEDLDGVRDAVDFIAELRQSTLGHVAVGRDVVVIGGGMTAVDAAVQAKLLGAENVTMVYRRGKDRMSASLYEQEHAASVGVKLVYGAVPVAIHGLMAVEGVEFAYASDGQPGPERFVIKADQVFKAIGQTLAELPADLAIHGGKVDREAPLGGLGRGGWAGVWAGGDCASGGEDLTVTAVAQGRDAAEAIHASLTGAA